MAMNLWGGGGENNNVNNGNLTVSNGEYSCEFSACSFEGYTFYINDTEIPLDCNPTTSVGLRYNNYDPAFNCKIINNKLRITTDIYDVFNITNVIINENQIKIYCN